MVSLEIFIDLILPATLVQGDRPASNRNEYHMYLLGKGGKGGRYVRLITLPPTCADNLKILEASNPWNPPSLSRPVERFSNLYKLFLIS